MLGKVSGEDVDFESLFRNHDEDYASADRNLDLALQRVKERQEQEALYFKLYGRVEVQEWLLKDSVRNKAYREAIIGNELFQEKTVLDVGCGTGMFSIFAAKAGASRVIAVDGASITEYARRIIQDNGFSSVITVVQAKVEEVELPDSIQKVDIILCDWMGQCLFSENMLESLIFARDKWLGEGGYIFPDTAQLYLAASEGDEPDFGFWDDVHGFDLGAVGRRFKEKAAVEHVHPSQVVSKPCLLQSLDLYTMRHQAAGIRSFYELKVTRTGKVRSLFVYFDVGFSKSPQSVSFSTSPSAPWTHWNQTVFHLEEPLPVRAGESIKGVFAMQPSADNLFQLQFDIYLDFEGKEKSIKSKQSFVLTNTLTLC
nr:protein arginine N-methyltransferase 8 isoform X2 [Drosophila bipectinata]XP_017105376.2 protein arginine N-methyltransferase 8 isoform X2 [Drosophila bipectinata]